MKKCLMVPFLLSIIIHAVVAIFLAAPMAGLFNPIPEDLPPPISVDVTFLSQKEFEKEHNADKIYQNTDLKTQTIHAHQEATMVDLEGFKKPQKVQKAVFKPHASNIKISKPQKRRKIVYKKAPVVDPKSTNIHALTPGTPLLIKNPDWFYKTPPTYPSKALNMGLQGTVTLHLNVAKDGSITNVILQNSSGHKVLDKAAIKAAKNWKMKPKTIAGSPQECIVEVAIPFIIQSA